MSDLREVEIRVVQDDCRRLAAQLQADRAEEFGTGLRDRTATDGRPGEGDLVDVRVRHDVRAEFTTSGKDADDPLRHACGDDRVGEQERVENGFR